MSDLDFGTKDGGGSLTRPISCLDCHALVVGPTNAGKTRQLRAMVKQLVQHPTRPCVLLIDPKGDLYDPLRRWGYQQSLDRRMVLINPGERRRIVGFNPLRPWPTNQSLQASVASEIFRRAVGAPDPAIAARMDKWIVTMHAALLHVGATLYEGPQLIDYYDSELREAITERLPAGAVRSNLEWLSQQLKRPNTMTMVNTELASTVNRVQQYVRNDALRLMLGTRERALDWTSIVNNRSFVLVNGFEGDVLSRQDQRTLVMQVISQAIRESFRRAAGGEERVPTYIVIDEAARFICPELETILNEGRAYKCRLVLGLQSLSQLIDPANPHDHRLFHAVTTNTRLKIIFGGGGWDETEQVCRNIFGPRLDPDKVKLELKSWVQLSHLEIVKSVGKTVTHSDVETDMEGKTRSKTRSTGEAHTTADGDMNGSGSSTMHGDSSGFGYSGGVNMDADGELSGMGSNYGGSDGCSDAEVDSEFSASSHIEANATIKQRGRSVGHTTVHGTAKGTTRGKQVTHSPMAVPDEPFEQTSSVQFEGLDEQLHRCVADVIRRPPQHAVLADNLDTPVFYRVGDEEDPDSSHRFAERIDLDLMRALPHFYSLPEEIEEEIRERQQFLTGGGLLLPPPIVADEIIRARKAAAAARRDEGRKRA